MDKNSTENIEKKLLTVQSYDAFFEQTSGDLDTIHPGRYILDLLEKKKLDKKDIVKYLNINTGYIYEILRQEKRPERDKILQFIFALKLDIKEAQTMLKRCGYAVLYGKNTRDSVLMFCISRKKSLIDTNILLEKYKLEIF